MADLSALDAVVGDAASVRVSELWSYGEAFVDLSQSDERERLRAAMAVRALPGYVCACCGQVSFEFLDAHGERLATVAFHHGITLAWSGWSGHAELADGAALERWLNEHGLSGEEGADIRPERLDWVQAVPPALDELANQLLRDFPRTSVVLKARRLMLGVEPVSRVLQLLAWCASGTGRLSGYPVHEDVPGLILSSVPVAQIAAALEDPRADGRHFAGAARHLLGGNVRERVDVARLPKPVRVKVGAAAEERGYEIPQWAERLLGG